MIAYKCELGNGLSPVGLSFLIVQQGYNLHSEYIGRVKWDNSKCSLNVRYE